MKIALLNMILWSAFIVGRSHADEVYSTPPFEYSFTYSKTSSDHTTFCLQFPQLADKRVQSSCSLIKDGQLIGKFPLRKMNMKGQGGDEMVKFKVLCLSDDLVSTGVIYLSVSSNDKSEKTEYYKFPLESAVSQSKRVQ